MYHPFQIRIVCATATFHNSKLFRRLLVSIIHIFDWGSKKGVLLLKQFIILVNKDQNIETDIRLYTLLSNTILYAIVI